MDRPLLYKLLKRCGINALSRRFYSPAAMVLMCHRVGTQKSGFNPNRAWTITDELLHSALDQAKTAGYRAVRLIDLPTQLSERNSGEKVFSLTFDDGYLDNLTLAAPICAQLDVPMTVFVTSGFIERSHTAWWHFLEFLIANNAHFDAAIDGHTETFSCSTRGNKEHLYARLSARLMTLDDEGQQRFVQSVPVAQRQAAVNYAHSLFLDNETLETLSALPHVDIGLHGVSHCPLANLPADRAQRELELCVAYLQAHTNQSQFPLAYPHGTPDTFDRSHCAMARALGVNIAVSTQHGCLTAGALTDSLATARIPIFPDDFDASLEAKFAGTTTIAANLLRRTITST